jgi:hypothetical protein
VEAVIASVAVPPAFKTARPLVSALKGRNLVSIHSMLIQRFKYILLSGIDMKIDTLRSMKSCASMKKDEAFGTFRLGTGSDWDAKESQVCGRRLAAWERH